MSDGSIDYHVLEAATEALAGPAMLFLLASLLVLAFAIVYIVYYCIVLNRIYKLFLPDAATGLTVLSVFVGVAVPIIFLVLSSREPVLPYDGESYRIPTEDPDAPADGGDDVYTL